RVGLRDAGHHERGRHGRTDDDRSTQQATAVDGGCAVRHGASLPSEGQLEVDVAGVGVVRADAHDDLGAVLDVRGDRPPWRTLGNVRAPVVALVGVLDEHDTGVEVHAGDVGCQPHVDVTAAGGRVERAVVPREPVVDVEVL